MSTIAELFGVPPIEGASIPSEWKRRHCPFTNSVCNVTANRGDRALFSLAHSCLTPAGVEQLRESYGDDPIPLGICSISTKRRFESESRPWIICPKRMMELRASPPVILPEVKRLIPINKGATVRCWWEFKFASKEVLDDPLEESSRFFEYTFDYILMPIQKIPGEEHPLITGPPYIIEIMTSSTRGGGLTEHMADALLGEPQETLRNRVKSPYTPNYRQVFGRMASQLIAKSEVAAAWGGRAIWVLQDVLLEYIEQTTSFKSADLDSNDQGNTFLAVYGMDRSSKGYDLNFRKAIRGPGRSEDGSPDFTGMLGLGYYPPLGTLIKTLQRTQQKSKNWVDFVW